MLTAAEVEQKTFSTALRGYDLDEVDDFLDEIVATIRDLTDQIEAAQSGAAQKEDSAPEPVVEPETTEVVESEPETPSTTEATTTEADVSAIGRAILAAQAAADRLLEDAQSEASRIVDDAKSEAGSWEAEREAKRAEAQSEIAALAARVASVRSELSVLAGEVSEKLDDMDAAIEGKHTSTVEDTGDDDTEDETGEDDEVGDLTVDDDTDSSATEAGVDHLDAILTGVATDLQLGTESDDDDDGYPNESEESGAGEDE